VQRVTDARTLPIWRNDPPADRIGTPARAPLVRRSPVAKAVSSPVGDANHFCPNKISALRATLLRGMYSGDVLPMYRATAAGCSTD
jgi:hypothetical protein